MGNTYVRLLENYKNWLTFDKVIAKTKKLRFFETQCIIMLSWKDTDQATYKCNIFHFLYM